VAPENTSLPDMYYFPAVFVGCRSNRRLRIRILKFPKISEFLRVLKLSVLKFIIFTLSHSSPPCSNKLFVANTALNFWTEIFVMSRFVNSSTVQHGHEQPCSFIVFPCQNRSPQLPTGPIIPFNSCLSVIDCRVLTYSECCGNWNTLQLLLMRNEL